jgi:hypothetical protein
VLVLKAHGSLDCYSVFRNSCSLLEHFRALPAEEGDCGGDEVDGVLLDVGAVEAGDFRHRIAVEVAADEDGKVILESEGAEIKELVVQGAQREAILHDGGAVIRMPKDVRGLQPDDLVVQLQVVAANGAAVPVVADDDGGKADVAFALRGDRGGLQLDAASQEDVLVLARRELVVKHLVGDGDQIVRPRPQPLPQLLRQRPRRVRIRQRLGRIIAILQFRRGAHNPNAIVHQPGPGSSGDCRFIGRPNSCSNRSIAGCASTQRTDSLPCCHCPSACRTSSGLCGARMSPRFRCLNGNSVMSGADRALKKSGKRVNRVQGT